MEVVDRSSHREGIAEVQLVFGLADEQRGRSFPWSVQQVGIARLFGGEDGEQGRWSGLRN